MEKLKEVVSKELKDYTLLFETNCCNRHELHYVCSSFNENVSIMFNITIKKVSDDFVNYSIAVSNKYLNGKEYDIYKELNSKWYANCYMIPDGVVYIDVGEYSEDYASIKFILTKIDKLVLDMEYIISKYI